MSEDVFATIEDGLGLTYALEGSERELSSFTGVVEGAGESQTYYEWRVVSMGAESGVELTAESGTVHTYAVDYFATQLETGRYRPAVRDEDGLRVASVEGGPPGPDASPGGDEPAESAANADADREDTASPGDAIDSPEPGAAEPASTVLGGVDEPETPDAVEGATAEQSPDADDSASHPDTTDVEPTGSADEPGAGRDPDVAPASAEATDTTETPDTAEAPATDQRTATTEDAEASDRAGTSGGDEQTGDVDHDQHRDEVEQLRTVVTDPTRHRYVRENAIRELADHGERGAAVLADVVDDESLTAEERALASTLLRDRRSDAA